MFELCGLIGLVDDNLFVAQGAGAVAISVGVGASNVSVAAFVVSLPRYFITSLLRDALSHSCSRARSIRLHSRPISAGSRPQIRQSES